MQLAETAPKVEPYSASLKAILASALEKRGSSYVARTRHKSATGSPHYTNRLILAQSPYLAQHAHNPVDWFPWSDEAFALAAQLGRPILLSVGYSTCHWCHVMEEESFEDEEIASYINENFVPIKVDREERPDVDGVYMAAVQVWTGHGGWPMTVCLKPDKKPFFGGTYWPARDGDRGARIGFLTLLKELVQVYRDDPDRVEKASQGILAALQERAARAPVSDMPGQDVLDQAYRYYEQSYDPKNGGIRGAPKFPSSLPVRFLLRYFRRFSGQALAMAETTLLKMAQGGIYDHVGGGFHRYTVDAEWLVPHFEKMLYDNALLPVAYIEAFQASGRTELAETARDTLNYLLTEMAAPGGGFFAATDADSPNPEKGGEREEGWYFTWTPAELTNVLGEDLAPVACAYFNVTPEGNFEGRNVLHVPASLSQVARTLGLNDSELAGKLALIRAKLYEERGKRPPPIRDDKVIAGWNGLALAAFARVGFVLNEPKFLAAARSTAEFLLHELITFKSDATSTEASPPASASSQGSPKKTAFIRRIFKDQVASIPAFLEDYAFIAQGFLDLYEAEFDAKYLDAALTIALTAIQRFGDPEYGGFFLTDQGGHGDHEALPIREKPAYDGAVPSGNSVLTLTLLRLSLLTGKEDLRDQALRAMASLPVKTIPAALSEMLLAVDFFTSSPQQIFFVLPEHLGEAQPFQKQLRRTFLPNRVIAATTRQSRDALAEIVPLIADKIAVSERPTAYVCEGTTCKLPVQEPAMFSELLT